MPVRFRSRDRRVSSGGYYLIGVPGGTTIFSSNGASGINDREECTDHTSVRPYPDNPLHIVRKQVTPLRLSGNVPYSWFGSYVTQYHNWSPTNMALYQYAPNTSSFDMAYFVTKALASLNPNAAEVDLPLFLFELREMPKMLKDLGDVLSRRIKPNTVNNGYLAHTFGWEPLVSDLKKLFDFGKAVENRIKYLKRLESGSKVQRSLGRGSVPHAVVPGGGTYGDDFRGTLITADLATTEQYSAWYTARVRLLTPLPPPSELPDEVFRILLGSYGSYASLWNALPWSFVVDYFAGIGNYIETYRGYIRYNVTSMCVMVKQEIEDKLVNVRLYPGCSYSGGSRKTTEKWRSVQANPIATVAADPFISGRQLVNLGSLALGQGRWK